MQLHITIFGYNIKSLPYHNTQRQSSLGVQEEILGVSTVPYTLVVPSSWWIVGWLGFGRNPIVCTKQVFAQEKNQSYIELVQNSTRL